MCPQEQLGYQYAGTADSYPNNGYLVNYAWFVWAGQKSWGLYKKTNTIKSPISSKLILTDSPMPQSKNLGYGSGLTSGYFFANLSNPNNSKAVAISILPERHGRNFHALMGDMHFESGTRSSVTTTDITL